MVVILWMLVACCGCRVCVYVTCYLFYLCWIYLVWVVGFGLLGVDLLAFVLLVLVFYVLDLVRLVNCLFGFVD